MPSSISALFSLSHNFVCLFFGGKVFQLSAQPALKYTPTRTTEVFLEPTRCPPSPASNGPAKFLGPYDVLVALAIVIIVSFASVVCSKGFFAARRSQCAPKLPAPPEPDPEISPRHYGSSLSVPPEPDLEITPRDYGRLLWFIFAFSLHVVLYVTSLSPAPTAKMSSGNLFPKSTLHLKQIAEPVISDTLDVAASYIQHIRIHGAQYLKFLCFAIAGHSLGFSIMVFYRHLRTFVHRHRSCIFLYIIWPPACTLLIPSLFYILHPQYNWVPWMHYYFLCRNGHFPDFLRIRQEITVSLLSVPVETVMIFAPLAIWVAALACFTTTFIIIHLPSFARKMARDLGLHLPIVIIVLCGSTVIINAAYCDALAFAAEEEKLMSENVKNWVLYRIQEGFLSEEARDEVWEFYRPYREQHRSWRIAQSQEFYKIMRLLWTTAGTTWKTLHWGQKFLIIAPAAIYYGYFYVMPVVRNIILRIKYWKYQRRWH